MTLLWECEIAEETKSSPVVHEGVVYLGDAAGVVHAVELAGGRTLWKREVGKEFRAAPLVLADRLIIGDVEGTMRALDAADGAEIWAFRTEGEINGPAVPAGDSLLFGSYDFFVYCLDVKSGSLVWKHKTGAQVHAAPGLSGGLVFSGGCDALLRALFLESGEEKWRTGVGAAIPTRPLCLEEKVVVGNLDGEVVCLNREGAELWRRRLEGESLFGAFASLDDEVLVPGEKKALYGLDVSNGEVLWKFGSRGGFSGAPSVAEGMVFIGGNDGRLHVIDAAGTEIWSFQAGGAIECSPACTPHGVVFCDTAGGLFCLSRRPADTSR
jgi:outer membrane protein assembly factor BamB